MTESTDPTDHAQCANGPDDCWHNPMGDPMVAWFAANSIDLDGIPMFPEIELLGGEMMIEFLYGYERDSPRYALVMRRPATLMVRRPILAPMDDELWTVYQRARAAYLADRVLKTLGQAGATVLAAKAGAHLVFVCANPMVEDSGFLEDASRMLQESLPGVGIQIMTGIDTILHRAPQDDSGR